MSSEIDDKFEERLAILDDQVACGFEIAAETLVEEPELTNRLKGALNCLQLLEQVWPRQPDTKLPAIPRVFGRYHVVRELGQGGFGIVFLAEDLQLARDVAIKVQRPESVLSPAARKRFLREARASAPLKHPNLVTVYDSGEDGLWCWIASEVVRGPALNRYLDSLHGQSKLPTVRDAVVLVRELAEGVAEAHAHGVLHRDIKPANILLDPRCEAPETLADYQAKLADFGLARSLESNSGETRTGVRLGTPAYMAPEQVEGRQEQIGPATDVYGLGALLYELLTGTPPFTGEYERDVLNQVLLGEPRSLRQARPEISRDLEAVVLKCLEKDPTRRYANVRALSKDLGRLLAGEPTEARPITAAHRAFRWTRRRPGLCLAVLASLIAIGFWFQWDRVSRANHQLLGMRTVRLATDPPGARIAFAPRDPKSAEPDLTGIIRPEQKSPVEVELLPGDYFVVAALPDGRFHEVFRHVPRKVGTRLGVPQKEYWTTLPDGTIELKPIVIPARVETKDVMAYIAGDADALTQEPGFYMDCHEFTCGEYKKLRKGAKGLACEKLPDGMAVANISLLVAMDAAEQCGKRLPTEREWERAARFCRRIDASPGSDRTRTEPPIVGLLSDLAEWSTTLETAHTPGRTYSLLALDGTASVIVRAATQETLNNPPALVSVCRDPRLRAIVSAVSIKPGLGFRCVRSEKPPF